MRRLGQSPKVESLDNINNNGWFATVTERLNVYSGAADPTAAEIPENQWIVFHNTASGETRVWTNIAGVAKKSAAFT